MFDYLDYKNRIPVDKYFLKLERVSPLSEIKYIRYWKEIKRRCIEGLWAEHNGEWKWLPGVQYFYTNFWSIELKKKGSKSNSKVLGKPYLRDIEWIKGYVYTTARGFSGFEDDENFSCHRILLEEDREVQIEMWMDSEDFKHIPPTLFKPNGTIKEYKPALEYLYEYQSKNLGKPLYYNEAKNVIDVETRNIGKTFQTSVFCGHNYLLDGSVDYDNFLLDISEGDIPSSQTLISAIDSKYSNTLMAATVLGMDNIAGSVKVGDIMYPSPLAKKYTGSTQPGKTAIQEYEEKIGGQWVTKGSKSKLHHRTFGDSEFAANGTRPSFAVIDEVGFCHRLEAILGQLAECTTVGSWKMGTIWMCVCASTKIWTADGRLINVENLHKDDGIIGWDDSIKLESPTSILRMFPPSIKQCYRITTNTGRTLECSHDHPILWSRTDYGSRPRSKENPCNRKFIKKTIFKETKNIVVGDQIAIAEKVEVFGEDTIWEPRLVGMLIGDGSYGFDKTPVFSNCDEELNSYVDDKFDTKIERSYITKDGRVYRETRIRKICPNLRELGIYGQTKLAKTLPPKIHSCTKAQVCELLAGLYDTDGHVTLDKNGKVQVGLTSSSKQLLEEVRYLLQKLGIHGGISTIQPRLSTSRLDKNVYYKLIVADTRSLLLFQDNITLLVNYKQERLNRLREMFLDRPHRQSESIEGLRFERVTSIEDIGEQVVYNLTAAGHNTYLANGIVTHNTGTGGDMEGGSSVSASKVFYDPKAYDCLEFDDIFEGRPDKIGFFVPAWMTFDKYRDEFGNVDRHRATAELIKKREILKRAKSKKPLNDEMQQRPLIPSDAFLLTGGNIFDSPELTEHLKFLETDRDGYIKGRIGTLSLEGTAHVVFKEDFTGRYKPCDYPLQEKDDLEGAVQIWKDPIDNPPYGYYIATLDPYAQDDAPNSVSLGSMQVFIRSFVGGQHFDEQVAEYTGRAESMSVFFETCRKLILYYNALCLYENNYNQFKTHMQNKNCLHLLAKTPTALSKNKQESVANTYGLRMTGPMKDELEIYTRDWLLQDAGDGRLNLHHIYSVPLLKELKSYTEGGNFDRVIALCLFVAQKLQMAKIISDQKKEKKKSWWLTHNYNGV